MPTCPGINPTLTLWALCYKAAEDLVSAYASRRRAMSERIAFDVQNQIATILT